MVDFFIFNNYLLILHSLFFYVSQLTLEMSLVIDIVAYTFLIDGFVRFFIVFVLKLEL